MSGALRQTTVARATKKSVAAAVKLTVEELLDDPDGRQRLRKYLLDNGSAKVSLAPAPDEVPTLGGAVERLLSKLESGSTPSPLPELGLHRTEVATALERHIRAEIASRGKPGGALAALHDRVEAAYRHQAVLAAVRETDPGPRWDGGVFALPPRTNLIGREDDLTAVLAMIAEHEPVPGEPLIIAIHGMPGVGKTGFAVELAWRLSGESGADVPFVPLRGWATDGDGEPVATVDAGTVLGELLIACGTPGGDMAESVDMRAGMWRREVTRHRFPVVVLEDARDYEQVRQLLPSDGDCVVLVTGRQRLAELEAVEYHLRPLSKAATARAFAGADGDLAAAERLAELTGGLPLAYDLVREALRRYRDLSLDDVAEELSELWTGLSDDEVSELSRTADKIWATFELSFRRLSQRQRRALFLLARQPGHDLTAFSLAAMMGVTERRCRMMLADIAAANLIERRSQADWRFHDLISTFVQNLARDDLADPEWNDALRRLLVTQAAYAADTRFHFGENVPLPLPPEDSRPGLNAAACRAWLLAERENLRQIVTDHHDHPDDEVARQILNITARLGTPLLWLGFTMDAQSFYRHTVTLARRLDDPATEAAGLAGLGRVDRMVDRWPAGLEHYRQARDLFQANDDAHGVAASLSGMGHVERLHDLFEDAVAHLTEAAEIYARLDQPRGVAECLLGLGEVASLTGDQDASIGRYRRAHALFEGQSDRRGAAEATWGLAEAARKQSRHAEAAESYRRALADFTDTGDRLCEADTLRGLGELALAEGRFAEAVEYLVRGRDVHHRIGDRLGQADATRSLGHVATAEGDRVRARELLREARELYRVIDSPRERAVARELSELDGDGTVEGK